MVHVKSMRAQVFGRSLAGRSLGNISWPLTHSNSAKTNRGLGAARWER